MVLILLHAVTKYGVALWLPCFYGQTLSRTVLACRAPVRHAENVTNFCADKLSVAAKISPFFTEL
jgi:hypothetical protein